MTVFRLPVSGIDVRLRLPTGAEDMLLVEAGPPSIPLALSLLERIVDRCDGAPLEWHELVATDVDVLLLSLRRHVLGDVITATVRCPAANCGARVDIVFSIGEFLEHHLPHTPPNVREAAQAAWFRLDGSDVEFRLPRTGDQLALAHESQPEMALVRRCTRPPEISDEARTHVEAAMEALAPDLFSELQGGCPECGAIVSADFDPLHYTLRELREQAAYIFEEVVAIARHTHWSEREILAMPTSRRLRYADLARVVEA